LRIMLIGCTDKVERQELRQQKAELELRLAREER
jgi:hypothetical protein